MGLFLQNLLEDVRQTRARGKAYRRGRVKK